MALEKDTSIRDDEHRIPTFDEAKSPTEQREALAVYEDYALTIAPESVQGIVVGGSMLAALGRTIDEVDLLDRFFQLADSE